MLFFLIQLTEKGIRYAIFAKFESMPQKAIQKNIYLADFIDKNMNPGEHRKVD